MLIESTTHNGLVRENNEDRLLIKSFENGTALLALADGMGGHAAGEIAAELSLEGFKSLGPASPDIQSELLRIVTEAQTAIQEASRFDRSLKGMGTTLTAVFIAGRIAYWAQVGDSRLYIFRSGVLEQLTRDHTIPGMLLDKGEISREQARLHPYANVLTRCLGCDRFEPDIGTTELRESDLLMLSTDGLHDCIPDAVIASCLALDISLKDKLNRLVSECLEAGAKDNITAILMEF
ncbi:MAG: protein phosphatase 2C domain-containing protein [Syntrophobacteraceae bacterium]